MSFELVFGYAAGLYGNDKGTTAGRVGDDCRDTAGQVTMGTGAKRWYSRDGHIDAAVSALPWNSWSNVERAVIRSGLCRVGRGQPSAASAGAVRNGSAWLS